MALNTSKLHPFLIEESFFSSCAKSIFPERNKGIKKKMKFFIRIVN